MTQDQAFSILKTGVSVFLTGEAGFGKRISVQPLRIRIFSGE